MKRMKGYLIVLLAVFCLALFGTQPVFCEMSNYELEQEIKEVKQKLELGKVFEKLDKLVSISGLVEVGASAGDAGFGDDQEDVSDITLSTVELGVDVKITDWVNGHVLLLWEEDGTDHVDLDEGSITLGNPEEFPLYLTVGKMYVPFGAFESNMLQDPLTLGIGETRESAIQIGGEASGFYGSLFVFNGDIDESGDDDKVKCFGVNAGYAFENDDIGLDIGIDWINNIADSDGLTESIGNDVKDYVGGFALHLTFNHGPLTIIGEYVGATDEFESGELDFKGKGAEPAAWNVEVAYTGEIVGKEATFALGYQGTDEAVGLGLPEERYLAAVGVGIARYTSLTLEYFHDEDYDKGDGGTGDDADMVTLQLAIEF